MGKMLIPKPFIVVKILDSDRVLLDIIKLCLPWGREWGVRITNGMSHGLGKNPSKFGDRKKHGMHVHQGSAYRCTDKCTIRK